MTESSAPTPVPTADRAVSRRRAYVLVGLFLLGLVLRVAWLPLWGTFDTEIQKAWSTRASTVGVRDIYGPPDRELLARARAAGVSVVAMPFPKTVFEWRHAEYFVDYPPGSVLVLWAAGRLYGLFDPSLRNGPWFNAAINLAPLIGSLAIALLLWRAVPGRRDPTAALLFWLNPAVLLAAPVLGYQDTVFGACALAAVLALMRRQYAAAAALVVVSGLIKPQGALLLPALVTVLVREGRLSDWFRSAAAGAATAVLVLAPWWTQGYLLSALDGCRRPLSQPYLAPLGYGLWWIVGFLRDRAETPWPVARMVTLEEFQEGAGWDARAVSFGLLLVASAVIVGLLVRGLRSTRLAIPLAVLLQVHAYAVLGVSVHENHSFLAVVLAPLLLSVRGGRAVLAATSSFLFANLFLTAGLGRRLTSQRFLVGLRQSTGLDLSVIVAFGHLALVLGLFAWAWRRTAARPADGAAEAGGAIAPGWR